jgi:hypothetical protein
MATFNERATHVRDCALRRLAHSPFLISYVLLIVPLPLLGLAPKYWNYYRYNSPGNDWIVLIAIVAASILQPTGSLLLNPASRRPPLLSRLNPLVCTAEGVSTLLILFNLHFSSARPLSYPAAATLLLYRRESSSLPPAYLHDLIKDSKPLSYNTLRINLGFPPLITRSITSSDAVYVLALMGLLRVTIDEQMYSRAPVTTMLAFFFIWSFGLLHLVILLATSRPLAIEENDVVEEEFMNYLQTHCVQLSLSPSAIPSRKIDLDDDSRRLRLFIGGYLLVTLCGLTLLRFTFNPSIWYVWNNPSRYGPPFPISLYSGEIWAFIIAFPIMLAICWGLMNAEGSKGERGKIFHWAVTGFVSIFYLLVSNLPYIHTTKI